MEKEPIFEIIIDGEVTKEVNGWERLDEAESMFISSIDEGFKQIEQMMGGSHGYRLYFNENTLKATTFAYREFTGFVDKNGDRVYDGDRLAVSWSTGTYSLNEYPEYSSHKGYYISGEGCYGNGIPISGKEIKKDYTVVHCVFPEVVNKKIKKKK